MDKDCLIKKLDKQIKICKKCYRYKTRNIAISGNGNIFSKIMIIGESPGKEEDLKGEVFVGKSGIILNNLLKKINIKKKEVYITNILKCYKPNAPTTKEISSCINYLKQQLDIIKPKILVCLGKYANNEIFKIFNFPIKKISEIHGKSFSFGKIKIISLYHPAYALHNSNILKILKKDFKKILLF
ncbi:MAG: hypothetical protein AMS24_05320 [Chlamydiae bacterium SM23_39]|nr:MAG: hypothetical protein AMS24_05320 [Chlamydiae bacterium SM23_39]